MRILGSSALARARGSGRRDGGLREDGGDGRPIQEGHNDERRGEDAKGVNESNGPPCVQLRPHRAQRQGEIGGTRESILRPLGERARDRRPECRRNRGNARWRPSPIGAPPTPERAEWVGTGEAFVEEDSDAEYVASSVDLLAARLLRRHVPGGTDCERVTSGRPAPAAQLGDSKVDDLRRELTIGVQREEDVVGLHVAVHDACAVGMGQRCEDRQGDGERLVDR